MNSELAAIPAWREHWRHARKPGASASAATDRRHPANTALDLAAAGGDKGRCLVKLGKRVPVLRLLRHYHPVPDEVAGGVVAIGNFDGVHRGHQAVVRRARGIADSIGASLGVLTFEPHPRSFFQPDAPPFRICSLRSKAHKLEELGADALFTIAFDAGFAAKTAEEFIAEVLVEGLQVRHVVVGYDFVFGHKRGGNLALLQQYAEQGGYELTVVEPVLYGDGVYSSTRIREHLAAGEPAQAAELLGHWWEVEGRVQKGDQRGRQLGFPTINLDFADYLRPAMGVYAVRVAIDEEDGGTLTWHDGVANFGNRPTFDGTNVLLEAHIFDFATDIYGAHARIAFHARIREERKFPGLEALKLQIEIDGVEAKRLLADPDYAMAKYPRNGR